MRRAVGANGLGSGLRSVVTTNGLKLPVAEDQLTDVELCPILADSTVWPSEVFKAFEQSTVAGGFVYGDSLTQKKQHLPV